MGGCEVRLHGEPRYRVRMGGRQRGYTSHVFWTLICIRMTKIRDDWMSTGQLHSKHYNGAHSYQRTTVYPDLTEIEHYPFWPVANSHASPNGVNRLHSHNYTRTPASMCIQIHLNTRIYLHAYTAFTRTRASRAGSGHLWRYVPRVFQ